MRIWRRINQRRRIITKACIVCGDKPAPWIWGYEGGEARMCDWHNASAQAERLGGPLRHEDDAS